MQGQAGNRQVRRDHLRSHPCSTKSAVGATVPLTEATACCSSPMAGAAVPDPVPAVRTPGNPGRSELTGCAYMPSLGVYA